MCGMCNTRDGKIAQNCIKYLCYSVEKWLKDLNVFCVSLLYYNMKEGNMILLYIMFYYIFI
jgi:hypothetical protein